MLTRTSLLATAAVVLAMAPLTADDWTQWRGVERQGVWHETGIVEDLPDQLEISWETACASEYKIE